MQAININTVYPERRNDQAGKPDRSEGRDTRDYGSDVWEDCTHTALPNATLERYHSTLARCVSPTDRKSCVCPPERRVSGTLALQTALETGAKTVLAITLPAMAMRWGSPGHMEGFRMRTEASSGSR